MTEIDSLQITIESNSKSAAQGIGELAGALENLKKNGAVSVAVKNLKALGTELRDFPDNSQAGRALGRVAGALREIKQVGSVKSAADSLSKLGGALRSLDTVKVDSAKITSIANALGTLSNVKAGGINTMMNGLLKIGKATDALNDDAINAFADRVDKLMEKLTPLSAKMTTIQSGFKAINSGAKSAGRGVKEMGEDVDGARVNLASFIYTIQEAVDWLQQAIQKFKEFISQAVEWDGVSARFGRTFGEQAEETYGWIQRLNEEMGINVQQFMQYSSLYSQMLTGFGVATEDARNMAVGYTELTYDIWAAANDRYKTFEDAADAVASAIAGEVEPIRRAGFTIVESTLAETAAYHGLDISIANATEAQKSYLRYLTLVDQAHSTGTIGVYAAELNTAEGMMRTFSQQLKSLTQAFGSLFLPVLVKVMPYLQAFVELLADGVRWIAALFGVEIQAVDFSGYKEGADALGGVADSAAGAADALGNATKAAKELKNATLGIDELNVISPQSATGGSAGGDTGAADGGIGGLDIGSLWDESIFDSIQSDVDSIKEKLRGWMPVIAGIAAGFAALRLAKLIIDIDDTAKKLKGVFGGVGDFFKAVKQAAPEVGLLKALFPKLSIWFASIGSAISGAATSVGSFVAGISLPVWGTIVAIIAAIASAAYFLYENWEAVKRAMKGFFDENIVPKLESIKQSWEDMKAAIVDVLPPYVIQWFKEAGEWIVNAADAIKEWAASFDLLKGIGAFIEGLGGIVFSVVGGVIATSISTVVQIVQGLVKIFSGAVQVVTGFAEFWKAVFTGDDLTAPIKKIVDGIEDYFGGMYDATIGVVVNWVKTVIDWFTNLWDELVGHSIVPDIVNGIVKWFTGLPGKVFKGIGNFFKDMLKKFQNLWKDLGSWWSSKKKLSDYTPNIGSIKDKLSSAWNSAKTWWNEKKAKLKEYTPSIGSIYEKVKERWNSARTWYNNKKAAMQSYTPTIGSIKDKLKSAWDTAKEWWKKNVKLSIPSLSFKVTYTDKNSLGTIKKAIVNALDLPGWPKLSFAANGGMFDMGSLVWAGERGPEIVASAGGGKTGVMNVQQMSDAMYEAVYSAVIAANRANSGSGAQPVNVYLDGRQIYASVKKTEAERGVTLMGNQLGYTY